MRRLWSGALWLVVVLLAACAAPEAAPTVARKAAAPAALPPQPAQQQPLTPSPQVIGPRSFKIAALPNIGLARQGVAARWREMAEDFPDLPYPLKPALDLWVRSGLVQAGFDLSRLVDATPARTAVTSMGAYH